MGSLFKNVEIVEVVHTSIQSYSKQSCPEKTTTTSGGGGLFIEHLTVHIRARHCMEIMVESVIIILQLKRHSLNLRRWIYL